MTLSFSLRSFLLHTFWPGIKAQFIIRKEEPTVLAHQASYDKKTLAQQVISLALGYRTALSSHPVYVKHRKGSSVALFEEFNTKGYLNLKKKRETHLIEW